MTPDSNAAVPRLNDKGRMADIPLSGEAKWRNFKLVLVSQKYMEDAAAKLPTLHIVNLITDPQERESVSLPYLHSWTATHFNKILGEFHASLERESLIPMGAPLDHRPSTDA
jgi:hypothetical protein